METTTESEPLSAPSAVRHSGMLSRVIVWITNLLAIVAALSLGLVGLILYRDAQAASHPTPTPGRPTPTAQPEVDLPVFAAGGPVEPAFAPGIPRLAMLHTTLPDFSAFEIRFYEVVQGDTLFGIAEEFDLKPQTLMYGNYDVLFDDPHRLSVGQTLRILPADGLLYTWSEGDGLNGVASFFKVTPDEIVDWPGNYLSRETLGDFSKPNIPVGTVLFVPNGKREFQAWGVPVISRRDPASARQIGPGSCGTVTTGNVGNGTFIFPTTEHGISGYYFDPSTNHNGVDFAGRTGNAIYASDGGAVVYAGWSDYGYGYMIVIDHGTGWQTLYAHLSAVNVSCGQGVVQGDVIGAVGSTGRSTGPHLHFELMSTGGGKVNPLDYVR